MRKTIIIVWIVCSVALYLLFGFLYGFDPEQWSYDYLGGSFRNDGTRTLLVILEFILMAGFAVAFFNCEDAKSLKR